jgi:hypothetical protein
VIVPLALVGVVASFLAVGPLSEIWERLTEPSVCWTSLPPGCEPRPGLTGPIIQLVAIAVSVLAAAVAILARRASDDAQWRELEDDARDDGYTTSNQ